MSGFAAPATAPRVTRPPVTVPPLSPDDRFAVDGRVRPLPAYDAGRERAPRPPGSPGSDLPTVDADIVVVQLRQRLGHVLASAATVAQQAGYARRLLGWLAGFPGSDWDRPGGDC